MDEAIKEIESRLWRMQDRDYKDFMQRLIPSVSPENVIGVRTPALRAYARQLRGTPQAEAFLRALPHRYFEENNLHAFLIEDLKSYDKVIESLDKFLPFVDNWATCDSMRPKIFRKHLNTLPAKIAEWTGSGEAYKIRFGTEMLMTFYLDREFSSDYLDMVAEIRSEEYYVNMMTSWFFATALAKQYEKTLPCIREKRLDRWTHNKAIQKSIESRRLTEAQKNELRSLRLK